MDFPPGGPVNAVLRLDEFLPWPLPGPAGQWSLSGAELLHLENGEPKSWREAADKVLYAPPLSTSRRRGAPGRSTEPSTSREML